MPHQLPQGHSVSDHLPVCRGPGGQSQKPFPAGALWHLNVVLIWRCSWPCQLTLPSSHCTLPASSMSCPDDKWPQRQDYGELNKFLSCIHSLLGATASLACSQGCCASPVSHSWDSDTPELQDPLTAPTSPALMGFSASPAPGVISQHILGQDCSK